MAFKNVLKGLRLPKVTLRELSEEDTSINSDNTFLKNSNYLPSSAQLIGAVVPYIKIAGSPITGIEYVCLDETGFIPTLHLTFTDENGSFSGDRYPKTNLILEFYIKSPHEKIKPLRADFFITSVRSSHKEYKNVKNGISTGIEFSIKAELYIPGIYNNVSKSYPDSSSKEALDSISEELNLGFACNEFEANDKMTWINPNLNYIDFINDITNHAYEGKPSFFTSFISKSYYLTVVEVNKQIEAVDFEKTFLSFPNQIGKDFTQDAADKSNSDDNDQYIENYLTTQIELKGQPFYIETIALIGDQGSIIKNRGFKKEIYYYDHLRKDEGDLMNKSISFFEEPVRSSNKSQDQYLIPIDEDIQNIKVKKWIGIDYGNAHKEWNRARLINKQNIDELKKIVVKVKLNNINLQIIKGMRIPVFISMQVAEKLFKSGSLSDNSKIKKRNRRRRNEKLTDEVIDQQLSGFYYVLGAKYYFDAFDYGFKTELILAKRDWLPTEEPTEESDEESAI